MLHEFLATNRIDLVERCHDKVRQRSPDAQQRDLQHGIGPFLDQLIQTLRVEQVADLERSLQISGPAGGQPDPSEMAGTATRHGRELLSHGYSIEQVVHDYGDLCQAITDLAFEREMDIDTDEFRTLNRCLDNAIAFAVAEYANRSDSDQAARQAEDSKQRLGFFAHDMRNLLSTATLAARIIRSGNVGLTGATGQMLERSLAGLTALVDVALAEVRAGEVPASS